MRPAGWRGMELWLYADSIPQNTGKNARNFSAFAEIFSVSIIY
jgi:hypothetical protein